MNKLLLIGLITTLTAIGLGLVLDRVDLGAEESDTVQLLEEHLAAVELTAAGMVPPKVRVPKDHRVRLRVSAGPDAPAGLLTLKGYQDRVESVDVGPGLARELVFVSDRPGDDFAFELGGRIVGRLEVTGRHLEDGHQ